MDFSSQVELPIKRPKCGHETKKRLAELKRQHEFTCVCGAVFRVNPDGFKYAGDALDDLAKAASKLGK